MAIWNPNKSPDLFPAHWHGIIRSKPGKYILDIVTDAKEARKMGNKFNAFKACLRRHPEHPSSIAYFARTFRLSKESTGESTAMCVAVEWDKGFALLVGEALRSSAKISAKS